MRICTSSFDGSGQRQRTWKELKPRRLSGWEVIASRLGLSHLLERSAIRHNYIPDSTVVAHFSVFSAVN